MHINRLTYLDKWLFRIHKFSNELRSLRTNFSTIDKPLLKAHVIEAQLIQCAKTTFTVLEETVRAGSGNLEIVKHPMIQKMIEVKWLQFGKRGKYY